MKLKYYSFSKRKNSTKQPTGGNEIDVVLKEPCSMLSPVFKTFTNVKAATYVYVSDWGRYYFVDDITHDGPEYIMSCTSDPMATFKSAIGGTYADVEYTSSSTNTDITDPRNKPTYVFEEANTTIADLTSYAFNDTGCFIVGIASNEGLNYYMMSSTEFKDMCEILYNISNAQALENQFFNLSECIVSAIWSAYIPAADILSLSPVTIGGDAYHTPIITPVQLGTFYKITQRLDSISVSNTITFPAASHGLDFSYLDMPPYSSGIIYLPFVGIVPLDLDVFAQDAKISIKIAIDHFTGDIAYILSNKSGDIISTYQGNCATNVPVSSQSFNAIGKMGAGISAIGGVASIVAGIATENVAAVGGGLAALAHSALTNYQSGQLHTHTNGSLSSAVCAKLSLDIIITIMTRVPTTWQIDTEYKAVSGMPYFKGDTISNLSGYVKCNGASVDISGFDAERDTINGYLNSGFYYE